MGRLFISHSSQDDAFVRELREKLHEHGLDSWIDSRELRGGALLDPDIFQAIESAGAFAVVVSPGALQSESVAKELRHAIEVQKRRRRENYVVLPLSLDGTKLGAFREFFEKEPLYIPVSSSAGGIEAALDRILAAMGERLPADPVPTPQPKAEPVEELVLELSDPELCEVNGERRASAKARLVYEPARKDQEPVRSVHFWNFVAPLESFHTTDLAWYLEKYAIWPSGITAIQDRARKVEENLVQWGRLLHDAAMPVAHTANVDKAWAPIDPHASRRFSVHVEAALMAGASEAEVKAAKEAATLLLGLPWELLHDERAYILQGATPTRVRRRLPFTEARPVPVVAPPIRILLVTARPEDEACGYIDHRASALPLVEAMEKLPGLVQLHVLSPPTLEALGVELDRARAAREPYHVVHFDGHGVYDRSVGLGGLCFEHPEDVAKLEKRRHVTVFTSELGPLLRDHRIPLVFLEACQTAQAEKASESVASELLRTGVASVVAMSHSVLVETARRFVEAFYEALAAGRRVGDAMLAGQRRLKDNPSRGRIFGTAELTLQDWFVPVLFQEKDDPQLFTQTPARQTVEDFKTGLLARLGDLPPVPETGFIGRSRELLALQRLLRKERWAVVRGLGGEGKTTLAAEFARWMVRSQQVQRAGFVSVEGLERNITEMVLDKVAGQLVRKGFSTQADAHGDLAATEREVERALREDPTLLVIDNMESILLPPFVADATPEALSTEARAELETLLALCQRLLRAGETRLVFTSREALPTPFAAAAQLRELHRLEREDAVKLIERVLNAAGGNASASEAGREEIEQLVEAVHGHARTLALLAPSLRAFGVRKTRESLVELMTEMSRNFPRSREQSLFASVELSFRRMSPTNRDHARVLGVFHGGVSLAVLGLMMEWENKELASLARELVDTGLATPNRYNHLTLDPALCPYLRSLLDDAEREALTRRWVEAMRGYANFLVQQQHENAEVVATLSMIELPNLFALLDLVQRGNDPEATIDLATSLFSLLENAGKPRLLERVGQVRDAARGALGEVWNHARFQSLRNRIDQHVADGRLGEASEAARELIHGARAAGGQAYFGADYDLAMAHFTLARVLIRVGGSDQALPLLIAALSRFEVFAEAQPRLGAEAMVAVCFAEKGDCLSDLGRLDEAAAAYEESIRRAEQLEDVRQSAVGNGQLGTVRLLQRRYPAALQAFAEARKRFTELGEPNSVAVSYHQIGNVYKECGQPAAAEDAYRKSLAINVQLGDIAGQANTLAQLAVLYETHLGRAEEAAAFYLQAVAKYVEIGDTLYEGIVRRNLGDLLRKLRRMDEARHEIRRSIECKAQFGHSSRSWTAWQVLADIETEAGDPAAAAEAKRNAVAGYLAYRRDGGENHSGVGRLAFDLAKSLRDGNRSGAASLLDQLAGTPKAEWLLPFIRALQAIVEGSRDRALADAPDLDYSMAAEILLLIETLEKATPGAGG